MTESDSLGRLVRFGAFEFDPATGELRKHGLRIKLNGQPIQLLAMLVQHPGKIFTREELQQRLWPAETYVDFEQSLNAAIKRLRRALGDSADAPLFIETIARQGYRFVAPLNHSADTPTTGTELAERELIRPITATVKPAVWRRLLPSIAAGGVLAIGAGLWLRATEYFWRSPIAEAQYQTVTNFDGVVQAAAVSRDGHFLAFLSDRDGRFQSKPSPARPHPIRFRPSP